VAREPRFGHPCSISYEHIRRVSGYIRTITDPSTIVLIYKMRPDDGLRVSGLNVIPVELVQQ
jgi:hypothetical protein